MINIIRDYLDNIFKTLPQTPEVLKVKDDLQSNMEEKYEELKKEGKSETEALSTVIGEFGNIEEILEDLNIFQKAANTQEQTTEQQADSYTKENVQDFKNEDIGSNQKKVWGTVFVLLAIFGIVSLMFGWSFTPFFNGWWTLFFIVPGIVGLLSNKDKMVSLIILVFGVLLLIDSSINIKFMWSYILVIMLLLIGIMLITGNKFIRNINIKDDIKNDDEIVAIFGGTEIDLRNKQFDSDMRINCVAIFGGAEIKVPSNINVVSRGTAVFGGVDSSGKNPNSQYTLYIDYLCLFGGIDIV